MCFGYKPNTVNGKWSVIKWSKIQTGWPLLIKAVHEQTLTANVSLKMWRAHVLINYITQLHMHLTLRSHLFLTLVSP